MEEALKTLWEAQCEILVSVDLKHLERRAQIIAKGLTGLCDACDEGYGRTKDNVRMHGPDCPRRRKAR